MIVQPYDYALITWFVLAGLSTAYVAFDQFRNNREAGVMKWGFILTMSDLGARLTTAKTSANLRPTRRSGQYH